MKLSFYLENRQKLTEFALPGSVSPVSLFSAAARCNQETILSVIITIKTNKIRNETKNRQFTEKKTF